VVTLLQGESILDAAPLFLDSPIREGATLRTSVGRVAVQFGDRSGFVVEENTTLELSRLDDSAVELRILSGAVAVDLTRRRSDQRFAVLAGDRSVEVRGTAFRVALADEALDVMVARGLVAVIEDADAVEVAAGGRLAIPKGGSLADHLPRRLSDREAKELARAVRAPFVPAWTGAPEVRAATAVLRVAAGPRARVRVDDVEVGVGTLSLRTVAGRHLVEAGAVSRWVELDAGVVAMTELVDPRSERPAQVDQQVQVHEKAIAGCAQRARKQDPLFEGQVVEVDVQIGADGSVVSVNSGNSEIENCVAEIARNTFSFPRGSRGTVRKRINVR
jgi:hypothetical protein